jgi:hypothetical protein
LNLRIYELVHTVSLSLMRQIGLALLLSFCCLAPLHATGGEQAVAPLPPLQSQGDDVLSASDRAALTTWALAHPAVAAHLGASRTRLLRLGADVAKGAQGDFRRASLYVRNYTSGLTHWIEVDLRSGAMSITDRAGLVQPSSEEIAEARALAAADPRLATLFADPGLTFQGGFMKRSVYDDDPCARNVCLMFAFMRPGFPRGPERAVIVDLSRRVVAHHDLQPGPDPLLPPRLTEPEPIP